jgi:hypothetical protein
VCVGGGGGGEGEEVDGTAAHTSVSNAMHHSRHSALLQRALGTHTETQIAFACMGRQAMDHIPEHHTHAPACFA